MSETAQARPLPVAPEPAAHKKEIRTLAEFLETAPPDADEQVCQRSAKSSTSTSFCLKEPAIQLHCDSNKCGGVRTFYCTNGSFFLRADELTYHFMRYVCRNCPRRRGRRFSRWLSICNGGIGLAQKIGEIPPFGPPTPPRVFRLIGEDYRELFLQGRRAENKGLGIGA